MLLISPLSLSGSTFLLLFFSFFIVEDLGTFLPQINSAREARYDQFDTGFYYISPIFFLCRLFFSDRLRKAWKDWLRFRARVSPRLALCLDCRFCIIPR